MKNRSFAIQRKNQRNGTKLPISLCTQNGTDSLRNIRHTKAQLHLAFYSASNKKALPTSLWQIRGKKHPKCLSKSGWQIINSNARWKSVSTGSEFSRSFRKQHSVPIVQFVAQTSTEASEWITPSRTSYHLLRYLLERKGFSTARHLVNVSDRRCTMMENKVLSWHTAHFHHPGAKGLSDVCFLPYVKAPLSHFPTVWVGKSCGKCNVSALVSGFATCGMQTEGQGVHYSNRCRCSLNIERVKM